MKSVTSLECPTAHILLVVWTKVSPFFKRKVNHYFFVLFVCVNFKKLYTLILLRGTKSCTTFWTHLLNVIFYKRAAIETLCRLLLLVNLYRPWIGWIPCWCLLKINLLLNEANTDEMRTFFFVVQHFCLLIFSLFFFGWKVRSIIKKNNKNKSFLFFGIFPICVQQFKFVVAFRIVSQCTVQCISGKCLWNDQYTLPWQNVKPPHRH